MLSYRHHNKTIEKQAKLMGLINDIRGDCDFYKAYQLGRLKLLTHPDYLSEKAAKTRSAKLNQYYYNVVSPMEVDIQQIIARIKTNTQRLDSKFNKYIDKGFIKRPINPNDPDYQLATDCIETIHLFDDVLKTIERLTELVEANARAAAMRSLGLSPKPCERLSSPTTTAPLTSTGSISQSLTPDNPGSFHLNIHSGSDADSPLVQSPKSTLSGPLSNSGSPMSTKPLFLQSSPLGTPVAVVKSDTPIESVDDDDRLEVYVI